MPSTFFKSFIKFSAVSSALTAGAFLVLGRLPDACGAAVGAAWIVLNLTLLFRLMEMSFALKAKNRDRVLLYSVLKFPVLYVAGYFILKSRFFPLAGILAGLTAGIAAFALVWLRDHSSHSGKAPLGKAL